MRLLPRTARIERVKHLNRLVWILVITVGALGSAGMPANAQLPNPSCLNCAVELSVVDWNGTGAPNTLVGGTLRIENTGESADTYTINVSTSNGEWIAEAEIETTDELAAGTGLLADTENNAQEFQVSVLVPEVAFAGDESGVTVTATSNNDDTVSAAASQVASASQIHAWTLDCTPTLEVQKTNQGSIRLEAINEGNGPDTALITFAPLPSGLSMDDPEPVTVPPGASVPQDLPIGVGISLEDGNYTLRWDLRSTKSTNATAECTSTLSVTGGTPNESEGGGGNESNGTPAPAMAWLGVLSLAALVGVRARQRP